MNDLVFFDVPVYRQGEEAYYTDRDHYVSAQMEALMTSTDIPRSKAPESYAATEQRLPESFGGPWTFNEIIGWVRLYACPSHIGGQVWWVEGKRITRRMRKRFYLTTPSDPLGTYFTSESTSKEIYVGTLNALETLARSRLFRHRYMDLRLFRQIGPFINWRALLSSAGRRL